MRDKNQVMNRIFANIVMCCALVNGSFFLTCVCFTIVTMNMIDDLPRLYRELRSYIRLKISIYKSKTKK